jgi:hypothetical protein
MCFVCIICHTVNNLPTMRRLLSHVPPTNTHEPRQHAQYKNKTPPPKKKNQRWNLKECEADSVVDNVFESGVQLGERIIDAVAQVRV